MGEKKSNTEIETQAIKENLAIAETEGTNVVINGKNYKNCLRNEKVTIRYVIKPTAMITDKRHVLYGGLAEGAHITLTAPKMDSSDNYVNILTNEEKDFLEAVMGLPENSLSIYKKENNYWDSVSIRLGKEDSYLDLSIPEDYIKWKVLLANKNIVCKNLSELRDSPKRTYRYVLISEKDEIQAQLNVMSSSMEAAMLFGKITSSDNKKSILRYILSTMSGKSIADTMKVDALTTQVYDYLVSDPKLFSLIAKDPYLETKCFISECVKYGLIRKRDNMYYLASTNVPLAAEGLDPTMNNAAKFLNAPGNQELYLTLSAKVNAKKE